MTTRTRLHSRLVFLVAPIFLIACESFPTKPGKVWIPESCDSYVVIHEDGKVSPEHIQKGKEFCEKQNACLASISNTTIACRRRK